MNGFGQRCVELRKKDYTLAEISRATGRPRASVFEYIRDIPLSDQKLKCIRDARAAQILEFIQKRRRKGAKAFKRFRVWTVDTVFLVSHFLFDGEIRHGGCVYNNRSASLVNDVRARMKKISYIEPKLYANRITGVLSIRYFNVIFGEYIKDKSILLLNKIEQMPQDLQREFLRSFFDDEGCMDFNLATNIRRVRGYQKNTKILDLVEKLLGNFNIDARVVRPNEVVITGKENLLKFQKEINFSRGVRINGNRPNSIWKKHLEKRRILKMAIESYKT